MAVEQLKIRSNHLHAVHEASGAQLVNWNQMYIPFLYSNSVEEHLALRTEAGLSDMSGIRKIWLSGPDAQEVLNYTITRDCSKISRGFAVYSAVLNDEGYVIDDAIIFNLSSSEHLEYGATWLICSGAGNAMEWLEKSAFGKNVILWADDNISCLLLQGPMAEASMKSLACGGQVSKLKRFQHELFTVGGANVLVSRTSYSGEDGFELFVGGKAAPEIWHTLISAGVKPVGLGAIDQARIEAGLLFFGRDMTGQETPKELALDFLVDRGKFGYRGMSALAIKETLPRIATVGVYADKPVFFTKRAFVAVDGDICGELKSYANSKWLGKTVGIAHVDPNYADEGRKVLIFDEGDFLQNGVEAFISDRKFYRNLKTKK